MPDDMQSIYDAVVELINEEWDSTHKGITQTMIHRSSKIPITTKVVKKSGKTKANILIGVYAEALRNEEIKAIAIKAVSVKTTTIYLPFNVPDAVRIFEILMFCLNIYCTPLLNHMLQFINS